MFIFVYQFILSRNNNLNDTYGYHWCKHAFNAATTIVANIVLSINGLTADAPNGGSAIPTTSLLPMFLMPNHFMTSLKLKCFMEAISWGANNGFSILYMHKVANALYDSKPLKSSYKQLELWIYANKVLNTQLLALFLINCLISIVPLKKTKEIEDSVITIAEDACKQTFFIDKYCIWGWQKAKISKCKSMSTIKY